jgi:hypothetical protein
MMHDDAEPQGRQVPPWLGWPSYHAWQSSRAAAWQAYLEQVEAAYARWAAAWGLSLAPLTPGERRVAAQLVAATGLWPPDALGQPPRWAA